MKIKVGELRKLINEMYRDPYHPSYNERDADSEELRAYYRATESFIERIETLVNDHSVDFEGMSILDELRSIVEEMRELNR